MKTWRGYNILDLILILLGVGSVAVTAIIFKSGWLILCQSILCLLTVFTQAKGKVITQFLGIINFILYIIISYKEHLYGEAILYLVVLIPMYVYGLIHWLKNKSNQDDVVLVRSNLSLKEWIIMGISLIFVTIGTYFLLKILNTAQLVVSTFSFVSMLPAVYLLARRCKWNQFAFLLNDFFVIVLWIVMSTSSLIFVPMILCFFFQLVYDVYGIFEWFKLEKKQKI